MPRVVVPKDALLRAGEPDALDHRGVVGGVRQHEAVGKALRERGQRRLVGHVAGGEDQRRLLAVPAGQLLLQEDMVVVGAGDVAGAPRARAAFLDRLDHGLAHERVLAHAEIVVGAPHDDLAEGAVAVVEAGQGKAPRLALEVGESAVPPLRFELADAGLEKAVEVHLSSLSLEGVVEEHSSGF